MALGSTLGAEQLAHAGFDRLVIDQEHGAIDAPLMQGLLQAISTTETVPLVRVPLRSRPIGSVERSTPERTASSCPR
jgi:2-keto-3-deoxy-L-rhamnonate aldolase RhmA